MAGIVAFFTVTWQLWLAAVGVLDVAAFLVMRQTVGLKGLTLSEHIWDWFSVKDQSEGYLYRRSVLSAFLSALGAHLTMGAPVEPVIAAALPFAQVILERSGNLKSLSDFLAGRKTTIGAALMVAGKVLVALPAILSAFGVPVGQAAQIVGFITAAIGLISKAYRKYYQQAPPPPAPPAALPHPA